MTFRPLSRRDREPDPAFDGPFEGVPAHLVGPLWAWVAQQIPLTYEYQSVRYPDTRAITRVRDIAATLRLDVEDLRVPVPRDGAALLEKLRLTALANEETFLDVVDLVANEPAGPLLDGDPLPRLEGILAIAGSAWAVGKFDGSTHLVRRVDQALTDLRNRVTQGRASTHLDDAWRKAFGRAPDATGAYRDSIRAVEAAARPVISPRNERATLGTMIGEIRDHPDQWTFSLRHDDPTKPIATVQALMELLWKGQIDRHGTPDEGVPANVSLDEATGAVETATVLVSWFGHGRIQRAASTNH